MENVTSIQVYQHTNVISNLWNVVIPLGNCHCCLCHFGGVGGWVGLGWGKCVGDFYVSLCDMADIVIDMKMAFMLKRTKMC